MFMNDHKACFLSGAWVNGMDFSKTKFVTVKLVKIYENRHDRSIIGCLSIDIF